MKHYPLLCIYVLRLLSGFFWLFLGQRLASFGEDRLASLSKQQNTFIYGLSLSLTFKAWVQV